jgi:hypothetical protein
LPNRAVPSREKHIDTAQVAFINLNTNTRNRFYNWQEEEVTRYSICNRRSFFIVALLLLFFLGIEKISAQSKAIETTGDILLFTLPATALTGAAIGIGSAYLFTTPYQKEHMELTFSSWEDNYALGL